MDSATFIEVQRRGRQEDVDGGHDVVRLGRYGMGAAFGIELQVTRRIGLDSLQAGFNLASYAGGKLQLPKRKAELSIPAEIDGQERLP